MRSKSTFPISRSGSMGPTGGWSRPQSAQHVDERIDVAQAGQEGGLLQCFLADSGHVGVLHRGVDNLAVVRGRRAYPAARRAPATPRCASRGIGVAGVSTLRPGKNLEQGCLAYLRQTDNSSFHVSSCAGRLLAVPSESLRCFRCATRCEPVNSADGFWPRPIRRSSLYRTTARCLRRGGKVVQTIEIHAAPGLVEAGVGLRCTGLSREAFPCADHGKLRICGQAHHTHQQDRRHDGARVARVKRSMMDSSNNAAPQNRPMSVQMRKESRYHGARR